jgi:VCBS repeat-containing protein
MKLPSGALLTVHEDGSYEYDTSTAFDRLIATAAENDLFTYTIQDSNGATSTATVTINIQGKNDAPTGITLSNDRVTTSNIVGLLTTIDVDTPDSHTYSIENQPASNFAISGSQLVINNRTGMVLGSTQLVTIRTTDAAGSSLSQVFPITIGSLGNANQAPIAVADSIAGSTLAVQALQVISNDSDPDGDSIMITRVNGAGIDFDNPVFLTLGRLELVSRNGNVNFHFFPNGTPGTQTFTYTISDGDLTATATVTLTLNAANRPPVANADTFGSSAPLVLEDVVFSGNVQLNDSDPDGDVLTSVLLTQPSKGSVAMLADGSFTFTPLPNENGTTSFTYRLLDGRGGVAVGSVQINITSVNDAPVGTNKTISQTIAPDVQAADIVFAESDFGFTDPADLIPNVLSGVRITSLPAAGRGTLKLNGTAITAADTIIPAADIAAGRLRFTPAINGFGTDYVGFDFAVIDNGGTTNGGINTDPTPNRLNFNLLSSDSTGPRITNVFVNSTAWTSTFRDFVDQVNPGVLPLAADGNARGYRVSIGAGQTNVLPWANINQIVLQFNEDVGSSLQALTASDFVISGTSGVNADNSLGAIPVVIGYNPTTDYNPATRLLTLRLNQSMAPSSLQLSIASSKIRDVSNNVLNGEWADNVSTQSGNAVEGGSFAFSIHVLPGDVNRSSAVSSVDLEAIALTRFFTQVGYSIWGDIDGNNIINAADRDAVLRRLGSRRVP